MISPVAMIRSCTAAPPLMIPDERKMPSTTPARASLSKAAASSSGEKVSRRIWLRPARNGQ